MIPYIILYFPQTNIQTSILYMASLKKDQLWVTDKCLLVFCCGRHFVLPESYQEEFRKASSSLAATLS